MLLIRRIANLFRRNRLDDDTDAELRAHIQLRTDDNVAAGMPQDEARRDANIRFGNLLVTRERTIASDLNQFVENFWRDLCYSARQLRHSRGFAVIAVLTLALAVTANIVVFGVLNSVLASGGENSERLFNIVQGPQGYDNQSYPDYIDYRNENTTLSAVAAYRIGQVGLSVGKTAYKCWGNEVSGNYFDLFGVEPALGRLFHAADERGPDSAPYVVLSYAFWQSHFAADARVVGRSVRLNQHPFTVIGVAPASFHGIELFFWPDFWIPLVNQAQVDGYNSLLNRFAHNLWVIGALKPGVIERAATANLNAVAARLARRYPTTDGGMKARLVKPGLMGDQLGDPTRAFLSAMMILTFLVLIAACTNLAGIFSARAADRSRELAIRLAIGSTRWHVLRQLVSEAMVLAVMGGLVGTLFATALLHLISRWQPFSEFPIHLNVAPGMRVYVVAALLSFGSGVLPGFVPAGQVWRTDLVQAIKGAISKSGGRYRLRARDLILYVQVALCALLLTASLVALRGMERSLHAPLGFDPNRVVLAITDMHMAGYSDDAALAVQQHMLNEAAAIPGILAVGLINDTPLGTGGSTSPVYPSGSPAFRPTDSRFAAKFFSVSPGYLRAARTRLLSGRDFTWHDDKQAPRVALVNDTFAQELFGSSFAVGRRFMTSADSSYQIVGIVEDGKYDSLTEASTPAMFFPEAQAPDSDTTLIVRSNLPAAQTASALSKILGKIDPGLPFTLESWTESLSLVLFPARAATIAIGIMGLFAAMLAVTGVFGMAAYSVSKRKKEFGIRIALGTKAAQLINAALGRPVVLMIAGSISGLCSGILASGLLSQIVYEATPRDPSIWIGVLVSMALLGILTTWIPARHALSVDPARLLREDT